MLSEGASLSKTLPYFKWYPSDAESDAKYAAMDDAELGFFHRCLNKSWTNGGLPVDPTERARILGRSKTYADKKWQRVGKCFQPSDADPDLLINPRQEKERKAAVEKSEQATSAVRSRRDRTNGTPTDVCTPVSTDVHTDDHLRALGRAESVSVSDRSSLLEDFEKFKFAVSEAGLPFSDRDIERCRFEWNVLDFEQKLAAIKGLNERKVAGEYDDPRYRPLPRNYLCEHMWQRPIRVSPQKQEPKSFPREMLR